MSREFFWGCELNKTNREYVWQPDKDLDLSTSNEEDMECLSHALILKQAFLGGSDTTVDSEVNIVELETEGYLATEVKQPIFRLKDGACDQCTLDLYIPKTATLRLISGSGPVHICGQHIVEFVNDEDVEEESEYKLDSTDLKGKDCEDVTKSDLVNEIGKRKYENGKSNAKKMAKMDYNSSSEEEDDEDDDEDDDDNGVKEVIPSPSPVKNLRKKPVAKAKAKNEQVAKKSKK